MLNFVALSPVLVLLAASLALLLAKPWPGARPFVALAGVLLASLLLFLNARLSQAPQFLFANSTALPDFDLLFTFEPLSLAFCALLLTAVLARLLLENLRLETHFGPGALAALAGAIAFFCAANIATLVAGWLLADLGLLWWRLSTPPIAGGAQAQAGAARENPVRALGLSQTGALALLGAGALAASAGSSLRFQQLTLDGLSAALVLVAAWIRSGFYPFHLAALADAQSEKGDRLRSLAFPGLMGLFVLTRGLLAAQGAVEYGGLLAVVALAGLAATSLLAVFEPLPARNLMWATLAAGAPVLLIPFSGIPRAHSALVVWWALSFFNCAVLGSAASLLLAQTRRQPWVQVLWGAAGLTAAGFPLMPGFLGRIGLLAAALQTGQDTLIVGIAAGTTLALIPFWRAFLDAGGVETRHPTYLEYAGIALLLIPLAVEGFVPFLIVSFLGRPIQDASVFAYDAFFHPRNLAASLIILLSLLLPLVLAYFIARNWAPVRARLERGRGDLNRLLDLAALARAAVQLVDGFGLLLRQALALAEDHPVGWLLFAAIWVALWVLSTRGG